MSRGRKRADESETPNTEKHVNLNRHRGQCSICSHEKRKEIEAAFVAWESPDSIAAEHGLSHRSTLYRHAKAFGLDQKRQQNARVPLDRIIERAGDPTLQVTGRSRTNCWKC